MRRPERLVYFKTKRESDDLILEALFEDGGEPILFNARLSLEDREYCCDVFSTNEGTAEWFHTYELLDACYCRGALEPEHRRKNKTTKALESRCTVGREDNNLY
jgi:hypothetical protein